MDDRHPLVIDIIGNDDARPDLSCLRAERGLKIHNGTLVLESVGTVSIEEFGLLHFWNLPWGRESRPNI